MWSCIVSCLNCGFIKFLSRFIPVQIHFITGKEDVWTCLAARWGHAPEGAPISPLDTSKHPLFPKKNPDSSNHALSWKCLKESDMSEHHFKFSWEMFKDLPKSTWQISGWQISWWQLFGWQMSYVGKCPRVAMVRVATVRVADVLCWQMS